jgi:hypothetical protein
VQLASALAGPLSSAAVALVMQLAGVKTLVVQLASLHASWLTLSQRVAGNIPLS